MSLSSSVGEMSAPLLRASLLLAVMALPVAASAQQRPAAQGASVQTAPSQGLRVVARVNDDAITDFDLSQRVLFAIRTSGLQARVTSYTTIWGAEAAAEGIKNRGELVVYPIQSLHAQLI